MYGGIKLVGRQMAYGSAKHGSKITTCVVVKRTKYQCSVQYIYTKSNRLSHTIVFMKNYRYIYFGFSNDFNIVVVVDCFKWFFVNHSGAKLFSNSFVNIFMSTVNSIWNIKTNWFKRLSKEKSINVFQTIPVAKWLG